VPVVVKITRREAPTPKPVEKVKSTKARGWGWVPHARKWYWHYFINGKLMCGQFEMNEPQEYFDMSVAHHPSNCPECWRVMKEKGVVK
jgi:hypothetical protein